MEKIYTIYIYVYGRYNHSYSIMIENHYRLVIDLWCRYLKEKSLDEVFIRSIEEAIREYLRMGLGDIPVRLVLQDLSQARSAIDKLWSEISSLLDFREVIYLKRWRVKRLRELAMYCYKNRRLRYPPTIYE